MTKAIKLPRKIRKLKAGVRPYPAEPTCNARGWWRPGEAWWMTPHGEIHELGPAQTHDSWLDAEQPGMTQDDAFNAGWVRLQKDGDRLLASNYRKESPTPKQVRMMKDHIEGRGMGEIHYAGPGTDNFRSGITPKKLWPARRGVNPENFMRKTLPKRYAKVDGHVQAHPLVAGFPLEHALRHIANDTTATDTARNLAKIAVTGKDSEGKDADVSQALWLLHDALRETNPPHPLHDTYNWMSAADKIHLDKHTYTALQEEADRMRQEHDEPPHTPEQWAYRPEGQALRVTRAIQQGRPESTYHGDRSGQALDRVRKRITSLSGEKDPEAINKSIVRHSVRAAMVWRGEHNVSPSEDRNMSLKPAEEGGNNETNWVNSFYGQRPNNTVTRYAREQGDRSYAWLSPGGKVFPVVGAETHESWIRKKGYPAIEDAYKEGWQRVTYYGGSLYTNNPFKGPSASQRQQLIDNAIEDGHQALVHDNGKTTHVMWDKQDRLSRKGLPLRKYSLAVRGDFIDSLRRVRSSNIQSLNQAAGEIAKKLGLHPVKTLPALHDTSRGATPGVVQVVYGRATPEQIHTAAAWIGTVGNLPGVMVHHVRPGGPDTLYKFRQTGGGLEIRHKLDRAGLFNRVLAIPHGEPAKVGFDVLIPDQGNRLKAQVYAYAQANRLRVEASPGYTKAIGSQNQGQARDQYRTAITKGERMARKGEPTKTILLRTNFTVKGEPKSGKFGHAIFTPEEYAAMRSDAAAKGFKFPEPPESHRPKPQQMKRKAKKYAMLPTESEVRRHINASKWYANNMEAYRRLVAEAKHHDTVTGDVAHATIAEGAAEKALGEAEKHRRVSEYYQKARGLRSHNDFTHDEETVGHLINGYKGSSVSVGHDAVGSRPKDFKRFR